MYLEHYGLREHPFQMTPDPRLFYSSSVHSRAYAHLAYGIAQKEGFIVITGEVGAGKTTLVERLCAQLDPAGYQISRIMTTQVSNEDLLRLVADAMGVPSAGTKAAVLRGLADALRAGPSGAAGQRRLLIVDEAQALTPAGLEELRMLSNVTDGGRALLQTILLGQPQLRRTMAAPDLDQLRQRVLASYHLGNLSREETHAYVDYRMRAVGWQGRPSWETEALDLVHQHSGGIPRRINRVCSRVLLGGALEEAGALTASLVETTVQELEEDLGGGPDGIREAAAQRGPSRGEMGALAQRLEVLERLVSRRERVFNRMVDLLSDAGARS